MLSLDDWLITQFFMWKKFDAKAKLKIKKEIVYSKEAKKAIFFFPYWTGKSSLYSGLTKNFPDYTLISYEYPNEIMSSNINVSLKYFRDLLKDAFYNILKLREKGYDEIILVGSSLGSNISLKLATMVRVDKLVLNMMDRSLAREIFTSPAMSLLRKKLESQGLTFKGAERIYQFISAEQILPTLKKTDTKILMYLSKNDIFCSLDQFQPVIDRFTELGLDYNLKVNKVLGHILSLYKNIFFSRDIIKFIREK